MRRWRTRQDAGWRLCPSKRTGLHSYSIFYTAPKALYNIASQSPVHTHIHTLTAVSATQGDSQLVRSSQGEGVSLRDTSTLSEEEPGIEPATFRLPADPLYHWATATPQKPKKIMKRLWWQWQWIQPVKPDLPEDVSRSYWDYDLKKRTGRPLHMS